MPDRKYTSDICPECNDAFCDGCDDPQIDADIIQSYLDRETAQSDIDDIKSNNE